MAQTIVSPAAPVSTWAQLLQDAVEKPGKIHQAYSLFWNYSPGNQMLALLQCEARGIQAGPIASFNRWHDLGRWVRKGEKAITLCMPVTCKHVEKKDDGTEEESCFTRFVYRRNWFVLAQTDGREYKPEPMPDWDRERALSALGIAETPFDATDGNSQGYASKRSIAVSPIAALPHKTTFHEVAHVLLGHTEESSLTDGESTPRSLREVEAESVALLCCESLGLPGAEYSRGYIQHWLSGAEIPERSAQKIFHVADQILRAGRDASQQKAGAA